MEFYKKKSVINMNLLKLKCQNISLTDSNNCWVASVWRVKDNNVCNQTPWTCTLKLKAPIQSISVLSAWGKFLLANMADINFSISSDNH